MSVITKYEIYAGANQNQLLFWEQIFRELTIHPLREQEIDAAIHINNSLKKKRKQIAMADLLIAAIAISNGLPLSTLNIKHFDRIEEMELVNI